MIVRIFSTAVDPEEVDRGIEIFKSDVLPAFSGFDGCHGVEWSGRDYEDALARLRELFRQTPIVHHYRTVE